MTTAAEKKVFILRAIHFLRELDAHYNQKVICKKLRVLGYSVSAPALSRLLREDYGGAEVLTNFTDGLTELLSLELGVVYQNGTGSFIFDRSENWAPKPVQLPPEQFIPADQQKIRLYGSGRRSVAEKVTFMASAREEVIIVGTRLRQLSGYFSGRSDAEFADHVKELLKKGVDFSCYMLDPAADTTAVYYSDQTASNVNGKKRIEELIGIRNELQNTANQLNSHGWPGKFSIGTYAHLPSAYYMAVDGERLMTSSYLFRQEKRNVPVMELNIEEHEPVFLLYFRSMLRLIGR